MKQTSALLFIVAISAISFMTSCQKAMDAPQYNMAPSVQIAASIHGTVIDENETPVAGAMVTAETATAMTDENGKFVISDVALYQQGGEVKVEKEGYLLASGSFVVNEDVSERVKIRLTIKTSGLNTAGAVVKHRSND